jgi:hypothetical protein
LAFVTGPADGVSVQEREFLDFPCSFLHL